MFVLDVVFFKKNASACSEEDRHKLLVSVVTLLGESYLVELFKKQATQEKPNQTKKENFIYLFFVSALTKN